MFDFFGCFKLFFPSLLLSNFFRNSARLFIAAENIMMCVMFQNETINNSQHCSFWVTRELLMQIHASTMMLEL